MVEMPEVMHVSILFFTGKERGERREGRGEGDGGKVEMWCHIFMETICEISFTKIGT